MTMTKTFWKDLPDHIASHIGLDPVNGDEGDYRFDVDDRWNFGGEDEEEYKLAVEAINKIEYEGFGWKIYANTDESGYHYWMVRMEERVSISITVELTEESIDDGEISILEKALAVAINQAQQIEAKFDYDPDSRSGNSFAVLTDETGEEVRISKRTRYVRTDGWRGYSVPVDAVAGANDTGDSHDSPCPSATATEELKMVTDRLDQEKILWIETGANTSNVFCIHR